MLDQLDAHSSFEDFVRFGLDNTAYVKPVTIQGQHLYAVFAADGTLLTLSAERALAMETVRQNDMEPISVH
jgi:hypothetical protein